MSELLQTAGSLSVLCSRCGELLQVRATSNQPATPEQLDGVLFSVLTAKVFEHLAKEHTENSAGIMSGPAPELQKLGGLFLEYLLLEEVRGSGETHEKINRRVAALKERILALVADPFDGREKPGPVTLGGSPNGKH